ncbi:hypothetical protein FJ980_19720 [Mesorhizobium sp. B1-1-5]|nr:hypothetical protein FJ980_19720 [Mesorhizobium sp. B1-1-5]
MADRTGRSVIGLLSLLRSEGQRPPLSCRTSPPQGGRSAASPTALHPSTLKIGESRDDSHLPTRGGDGGRPEGGAKERRLRDYRGRTALPKPFSPPSSS